MNSYKGKFKGYLSDLARRKPSPGGGSAICLVFCIGVSLIEKAINYSWVPKPEGVSKKTKNRKLKTTLSRLRKLTLKIYPSIDNDSIIFAKIMNSKGKNRLKFVKGAQQIIIDTAGACQAVFSLAKDVESDIKKSILSDFQIGSTLVKDVLLGCILNLEANQKMFGVESKDADSFRKVLKKWQ
ncbi:MAG: cyclodeaminase/cyclohydrolase family protein [Omnitrophica bacterium]|nr:cyclodeaminase/cyclohydrolase family protein [Candidatus Omnitrophota bacterium]